MRTTTKTYLILIALILVLGLTWPLLKIGLHDISPFWLSAICLFFGALVMFALNAVQKQFIIPSGKDWAFVFSIAVFQMGAFTCLISYGLLFVPTGRSAILAYSTAIWVAPLAAIFFGEKFTFVKILGLLLGIAGILVLFNPLTFPWSNYPAIKGNAMLLLAALCWAIAILHTRYGRWHSTAAALLPWQLLLGGIFITPLAIAVDPVSAIHWTPRLIGILIYIILLGTAFAYWGLITISRTLPVMVTSLSLLLVPVIGLIFATLLVGEPITIEVLAAMVLIISGLVCMTLANRPRKTMPL